jgi:hypothetical protein
LIRTLHNLPRIDSTRDEAVVFEVPAVNVVGVVFDFVDVDAYIVADEDIDTAESVKSYWKVAPAAAGMSIWSGLTMAKIQAMCGDG